MNGKIELESKINEGSKFIVHFSNVKISKEEKPLSGDKIIDLDEVTFEKSKILIIDDIYENMLVLSLFLKKYNFEIMEAKNWQEAHKYISYETPDLIFLDINLPQENGYEILKLLRNNPKWENIPVIAVTAYTFDNKKEKLLNAGFNDYIAKPIDYKILKKTLFTYVKHYKVTQKEIKNISSIVKLNIEAIEFFPQLNSEIETKVLPIIKSMQKIQPKKTVIECAELLIEIGKKFKNNQVLQYGKDLKHAKRTFNIEKQKNLITNFNLFMKRLNESYKITHGQ